MSTQLVYVHDPMCSLCWAFRPVYDQLEDQQPAGIRLQRLLGGLAADTDEPMPQNLREYVQNHWRTIQTTVPGTQFNFDFWKLCRPRRATWPACRAVIAARKQGDDYDDTMTRAIQHAYYLDARNPSEHATLIELAIECGLDERKFAADLAEPQTSLLLETEIATSRNLGLVGFPSLALCMNGAVNPVPVDYHDSSPMLEVINLKFLPLSP
mgnify:CR=1 FL=1